MANIYPKKIFSPDSDLIKSINVWTFKIKQYFGCRGLPLKHQQPKNNFWGVPPLASLESGHEKKI